MTEQDGKWNVLEGFAPRPKEVPPISEEYLRDYAGYLDRLTASEEGERIMLGGVRQGLWTREEWERIAPGEPYEDYLRASRINLHANRQGEEEIARHLRRFFGAERLGIPHHGQTDERL